MWTRRTRQSTNGNRVATDEREKRCEGDERRATTSTERPTAQRYERRRDRKVGRNDHEWRPREEAHANGKYCDELPRTTRTTSTEIRQRDAMSANATKKSVATATSDASATRRTPTTEKAKVPRRVTADDSPTQKVGWERACRRSTPAPPRRARAHRCSTRRAYRRSTPEQGTLTVQRNAEYAMGVVCIIATTTMMATIMAIMIATARETYEAPMDATDAPRSRQSA